LKPDDSDGSDDGKEDGSLSSDQTNDEEQPASHLPSPVNSPPRQPSPRVSDQKPSDTLNWGPPIPKLTSLPINQSTDDLNDLFSDAALAQNSPVASTSQSLVSVASPSRDLDQSIHAPGHARSPAMSAPYAAYATPSSDHPMKTRWHPKFSHKISKDLTKFHDFLLQYKEGLAASFITKDPIRLRINGLPKGRYMSNKSNNDVSYKGVDSDFLWTTAFAFSTFQGKVLFTNFE